MSAYEKAWEALAYIRGDHVTWEEAEDRLASALTDLLAEHASLRNAIEIEREGQRSMAYALAEINRLSRLSVAINLVAPTADAATEDNESGVEGVCRACDPLVCEEQGRWQKRIENVISEAGFEPCDASGNESGDPLDYSADQIESALTHALHLEEADAATEAVREAKERLWDALDRESLGGTYLAARGLRAALSTPAPAPSAPEVKP